MVRVKPNLQLVVADISHLSRTGHTEVAEAFYCVVVIDACQSVRDAIFLTRRHRCVLLSRTGHTEVAKAFYCVVVIDVCQSVRDAIFLTRRYRGAGTPTSRAFSILHFQFSAQIKANH